MSDQTNPEFPINSLALRSGYKYDYCDTFSINLNPNVKIKVEDLFPIFFASIPKVFFILFIITEKVAKVIGLKTSSKIEVERHLKSYKGEVGQSIG